MSATLLFRWITFLLAAGFCVRIALFSDYDHFGGPFRYLVVWALFFSFFCASRLIAIMERRSARRWDAFISMTAVINVLVIFFYWQIVSTGSPLASLGSTVSTPIDQIYLYVLGPSLQIVDAVFIHRAFRRPKRGFGLLVAVVAVYTLWIEGVLRTMSELPFGRVTSGLPYPFLNDLTLPERATLYGITFAIVMLLMVAFALISAKMRRLMLRTRRRSKPVAPRATRAR